VSDPTATFATPRIAAGALFVDGDRILLLRKTYGNGRDIPGGYAEVGESPAAAWHRELKEELGIQRDVRQLLIVGWAPASMKATRSFTSSIAANSAPTRTASSLQATSWTNGNGCQSVRCRITRSRGWPVG
jgi:ADP-ribose pyrophosphatase YjhB (NUDIX family)